MGILAMPRTRFAVEYIWKITQFGINPQTIVILE